MRNTVLRKGRGLDLSIIAKLRRLPAYMMDPAVAAIRKIGVVAGLLYVISPIDAIPDVIPVVGWLDDVGVLAILYMSMMRELEAYVSTQASRR